MQPYFNLLNDFFDKIYVITLARAVERHEHIERELHGLNYTLFFGKDKREFTIEDLVEKNIYNEVLARKHHRYGKGMPPGMIGCSWSHKLVYEDIFRNNYQTALIMEDDIVIDRKAITILPDIFLELPKDWELLYFGFALNEHKPKNAGIKKIFYHLLRTFTSFKLSRKTISNLYPKKLSNYILKAGYHDCTHAYALNQWAAKKLYELQTPISFFPDNLLAYAATNEIINAYITRPKLINQISQLTIQPTHSYINE